MMMDRSWSCVAAIDSFATTVWTALIGSTFDISSV